MMMGLDERKYLSDGLDFCLVFCLAFPLEKNSGNGVGSVFGML